MGMKHPHRLLLVDKKIWRCTLDGCTFFVHMGLVGVLPGKQTVCWECGDNFKLDVAALKEDMPRCSDCRMGVVAQQSIEEYTEARIAQAKKRKSEFVVSESDVVESESAHSPDCDVYSGLDCSCMK